MILSLLLMFSGMALLYLALQNIQQNIDQFIFHRLRGSVSNLLSGGRSLWLSGALSALILQATSIPIQMAITMRERRFFSTEQSFLFILGASLGGSLKAWLFAASIQLPVSALLFIFGSLMHFWPGARFRFLSRPLVGAACFWASLELVWQGCAMWLPQLMIHQLWPILNPHSLLHQVALILLSVVLVVIFRSGTLPIFLVIQLVIAGVLELETGAAMMLGINMGMGIDSIDKLLIKKSELRQLVWINAMNRFFVGLTLLLFFPYLLSFVSMLVPIAPGPNMLAFRVAAVHLVINISIAMNGFFLFGLFQRFAYWLAPEENQEWRSLVLSKPVRRMLQSAPDYALPEVENQLQIAMQQTKKLTDYNLRLLTEKNTQVSSMQTEMYLYETIEQSIYDLLISLFDNPQIESNDQYQGELNRALKTLDANSALYIHAFHLNSELVQGFSYRFYFIPIPLRESFLNFQIEFNELWLNIILRKPTNGKSEKLLNDMIQLEALFNEKVRPQIAAAELNIWLYRILSMLRQQCVLLDALCCLHAQSEVEVVTHE